MDSPISGTLTKQTLNDPRYEFIDCKCEKEFGCFICSNLCLDPVVIGCCGSLACRSCVMNATDRLCVRCQKDWNIDTLIELDTTNYVAVRNIISRPIVRCNACKLEMSRGLKGEVFEKHYQEVCIIPCTNAECKDTSITRATLEEHRKICLFEWVPCSAHDIGCDMNLPRRMIKNHEKECVKYSLAPMFRKQQQRILQLEDQVANMSISLNKVLQLHIVRRNILIDFKEPIPSSVEVEGLSGIEGFGRWSDGEKVSISFRRLFRKSLNVKLTAAAFGPNVDQDFTVTIGKETKSFRLTGVNSTISLDFRNIDINDRSLLFTIPQPISPKELGISEDTRRLGMAMDKLTIEEK